jgi:glucose-1-phosphate thymidylyltransferase
MWGIIPAAGNGTRIQPLAFSKELLPVSSRFDGDTERPRAVSEYLVDRMLHAGADRICFVISPWISDILQYYGARIDAAALAYIVQPEALGPCDAIFRALPLIRPDEQVLVGLPDTIWLPEDGLAVLPGDKLAFLTFPVARPEFFDAVASDCDGRVREIQVKSPAVDALDLGRLPAVRLRVARITRALGTARAPRRIHRTLWSTPISRPAARRWHRPAAPDYVDVGTLGGYREAMRLLNSRQASPPGRFMVANAGRETRG